MLLVVCFRRRSSRALSGWTRRRTRSCPSGSRRTSSARSGFSERGEMGGRTGSSQRGGGDPAEPRRCCTRARAAAGQGHRTLRFCDVACCAAGRAQRCSDLSVSVVCQLATNYSAACGRSLLHDEEERRFLLDERSADLLAIATTTKEGRRCRRRHPITAKAQHCSPALRSTLIRPRRPMVAAFE